MKKGDVVRIESARVLSDTDNYLFAIEKTDTIHLDDGAIYEFAWCKQVGGDYSVVLQSYKFDKYTDWYVYRTQFEIARRDVPSSDMEWIFKKILPSLNECEYVDDIDDDSQNRYFRSIETETGKNSESISTCVVRYKNDRAVPTNLLFLEIGFLNPEGGWIEFMDGDLVEEHEIKF